MISTRIPSSLRNLYLRYAFVLLLLPPSRSVAQTFAEFVTRVESAPEARRTALVDSFMRVAARIPLVEHDTLCTFIWRGWASRVALAGDHNGWNPARGSMARLASTNLWYRSDVFPADARLDYKIVKDDSVWTLDPLNPHTMIGGFGSNSELRMPRWVSPRELLSAPGVPHGKLIDTTMASAALGNTRRIKIYVPKVAASSSDSFAVIVVHDGLEYVDFAKMQNVLDNLISAKATRPVVAVFVPPVARSQEYSGTRISQFTTFIVYELLPFLRRQYRISSRPSNCATLGASDGGNIALWLAMTHPEVFGGAAAQSSSIIDTIAHGFQSGRPRDLRIYLDIGVYDIPVLVTMVRNFRTILDSRGYAYKYEEVHEGHSWGSWRSRLGDVLKYLFPNPLTEVKKKRR